MHAIFTAADAAKREQSFFISRDSLRITFTGTTMVIFQIRPDSVGMGRASARSGRARFKAFFRVLPSGFGASGELVFTFLRRTHPGRAGARPYRLGET